MTKEQIRENASIYQLRKIAEFETVRKNALANPNLYEGRYTQKNNNEALICFLLDELEKNVNYLNYNINLVHAYDENFGNLQNMIEWAKR